MLPLINKSERNEWRYNENIFHQRGRILQIMYGKFTMKICETAHRFQNSNQVTDCTERVTESLSKSEKPLRKLQKLQLPLSLALSLRRSLGGWMFYVHAAMCNIY